MKPFEQQMVAASSDMLDETRIPIRVMVVDDHDLVREGLRSLLEASGEMVVAEAGDVATAVREAVASKPQVVLMDVRLGSESGVTATRGILALLPKTRVVMLTSYPDEEAMAASMRAGASGFILKDLTGEELIRDIRAIAQGRRVFDEKLVESALEDLEMRTIDIDLDERGE